MASSTNTAAKPPRGEWTPSTWLVWWPAIVMMFGTLLSYLDRQVLALLSPMILADTHLTALQFTQTISAFSYAYMVSTLIWGSVIDRIGLRMGMLISIAIWAVSSASHALVSTFMGFAMARLVLGIGEGSMFPGGFRTAMDSLPPVKQARGLALAYSGSSIGAILAPIIFIPIAAAYGWRPAFLVTPVLALIWLIIWRFTVDPAKFPHKARAQKLRFPSPLERRFWSLVFSYSFGAFPVGVIAYLSPLLLSRAYGMTQKQLGAVLWIPPAGLEAGFFLWGWISDRYFPSHPRPKGLLTVMAMLCIPALAVTWFHSPAIAVALLTTTLFASAGLIVVTLRTGSLTYAPHQRSMAAGIASSSFSATVALLLPVCGRFFDHRQYQGAFTLVAFMPLLGILIWLCLPVRSFGSEEIKA